MSKGPVKLQKYQNAKMSKCQNANEQKLSQLLRTWAKDE